MLCFLLIHSSSFCHKAFSFASLIKGGYLNMNKSEQKKKANFFLWWSRSESLVLIPVYTSYSQFLLEKLAVYSSQVSNPKIHNLTSYHHHHFKNFNNQLSKSMDITFCLKINDNTTSLCRSILFESLNFLPLLFCTLHWR